MNRQDPGVDAARLALMLTELRLPTLKAVWPRFTEQADQEGWPAAHTLAVLAEQELADRAQRRIERHLTEAQLPPGKTLENFDFTAVPMIAKAQVMALTAGFSSRLSLHMPLHVLQELGGWSCYAMVQRYAHMSAEHLAEYAGNVSKIRAISSTLLRTPAEKRDECGQRTSR